MGPGWLPTGLVLALGLAVWSQPWELLPRDSPDLSWSTVSLEPTVPGQVLVWVALLRDGSLNVLQGLLGGRGQPPDARGLAFCPPSRAAHLASP